MNRATRSIVRKFNRAAVSVLAAAALALPAIPLSAIIPAYADQGEEGAQAAQSTKALNGASSQRVSADLPLDGSSIDSAGNITSYLGEDDDLLSNIINANPDGSLAPKSEEEKQAILDGYLADGTIDEDDLNDA